MRNLLLTIVLAAALWTVMFSPWTAPHVPFWYMMAGATLVLCVISTCLNPGWYKHLALRLSDLPAGMAIAAMLWGIFWMGDKVSALLFDFARPQVDSIYAIREGQSPWLLSILMFVLMGPAEEIYWRGYVQRTLSVRLGAKCRSHVFHSAVCVGSCRFVQFHALYGRIGRGSCMGNSISVLSRTLLRHNSFSCIVGCGNIQLVPYMIFLFCDL